MKIDKCLRSCVCQILLEHLGHSDLWTEDGPTEAAYGHLNTIKDKPTPEQVLTLAAWTIWNGNRELRLADVLKLNDSKSFSLISGYLTASRFGDESVKTWISAKRTAGERI